MSDSTPADPRAPADFESELPAPAAFVCDHCGRRFEGTPSGAGLLLWTRGEEVRFEEPPLCEECASKLTLGAFSKWEKETDEES